MFNIFYIVLFSAAFASDLPEWVVKTPSSDSDYKYYVGRSEPLSTEAAAFTAADKNAREQAIKDNFGSDFQVSTVSSDSLQNSASHTRIQELSANVNLSGLEMVDDKLITSEENGRAKYARYILFKYSKNSIIKEKERLLTASGKDLPEFNITGDQTKCHTLNKTNLEVTATEFKSKVIINGEVIGFTPLKIFCFEINGSKIKLQIDHPYYETYEDNVLVIIGGQTKIHAILKKSYVKLSLNSDPQGANVFIDSESKGVTPLSDIKVQAGKFIKIEFTHPETDKIIQEIFLNKSDGKEVTRSFKLPYKPSYFSVSSIPLGADIYIDNVLIGVTPMKNISCAPGAHNLKLHMEGFNSHVEDLNCVGGLTVNSEPTTLSRYTKPINKIEISPDTGINNKIDLQYSSSTSPFEGIELVYQSVHINFASQIYKGLSYSVGFGYLWAERKYSNASLESTGLSVNAGLPYYFFTNSENSKWFEIKPEVAFSSYSFKSIYVTNEAEVSISGKTQISYGLVFGYKFNNWFTSKFTGYQNGDSNTLKGKSNYRLSLGGSWDF